jgi:hypothetical protein
MNLFRVILCSIAIYGLVCFESSAQLSQADFEELHAELQPDETEPWRQIPWQISVLKAQQIAASEGKPIFIWAMDGHPLGCT